MVAVLLGAVAAGGVLTYTNRQRADDWRDRSVTPQDLVAERTKASTARPPRSNVASTTLRKARGSITRSEKDVAQLEVNTADGRTLDVSTAQVGVLGDVAFVTVDGTLPVSEPGGASS